MDRVTAKSRYSSLETFRTGPLERARTAAEYTIPSLFPKEGSNDSSKLATTDQSIGARGVNNLASKFLMTLLPPNESFFKLNIDEYTLEELSNDEAALAEAQKALSKIERTCMLELESLSARAVLSEGFKQLIVAGNALLFLDKKTLRTYRLDKYVIRRDPAGNVLEIVIKESVSPLSLPEKARELAASEDDQKTVELYTHVKRTAENWAVYQEINENIVPDSQGAYPLDNCPWIPLRFTRIDGEYYGRGYVEEYLGDLIAANGLQKAIVQSAVATSKLLIFVDPNGVTKIKDISEAPNGAVRAGREQDVSMLQLNKAADLQVALETLRDIIQRLSYAFLLNSSIQRKGERVTAVEIRYMAGELEDVFGGTYSVQGQEFQIPFVNVLLRNLTKQKRLPQLPKDVVKPTITAGLDALGRSHDLIKMDEFLQGAIQTLGPETVAAWVNAGDYLTKRAAALSLDSSGLVKTKEQKQEEDRQNSEQMMQQMLQQQMMQTGGKVIENATKGTDINVEQ